jgi:hypothetical protein
LTSPLPASKDDPSIVRGQVVQAEYLDQLKALRSNHAITDLDRARGIDAAWRTACTELAGLYEDLRSRRQVRLADLEQMVPVGPSIPADASAADRAVLQAAWKAALAEARAASGDQLSVMLADAVRFGDELAIRAVTTVVIEEGRGFGTLREQVLALDPGAREALDEIGQLRGALAGETYDGWVNRALSQPRRPEESTRLNDLEAMHKAREAALQAQRRRFGN